MSFETVLLIVIATVAAAIWFDVECLVDLDPLIPPPINPMLGPSISSGQNSTWRMPAWLSAATIFAASL
jgi:hypothetical protein